MRESSVFLYGVITPFIFSHIFCCYFLPLGSNNCAMQIAGEIASALGVAKETIEAWARDSKIPAFKVGRSWKFIEADVLKALRLSGNDLSRAMGRAA
jgi:excisionase family DNA binding protein